MVRCHRGNACCGNSSRGAISASGRRRHRAAGLADWVGASLSKLNREIGAALVDSKKLLKAGCDRWH